MLEKSEAKAVYEELRELSAKILPAIGCKTEPHEPVVRTKKWKHGKPRGILYHYTNGPNGVKSTKWGNDPTWGNTGSSWHVMIFDRLIKGAVGDTWIAESSDRLLELFPVPTLITASWLWGTWHGNWTNDVLLGVENRNCGYSGWLRVDKNSGIEKLGKTPAISGGRKWEPFTREQLIANINIGRVCDALFSLLPSYVLSHQCVCARKADTGHAFPLDAVRSAVFAPYEVTDGNGNLSHLWLKNHAPAPQDGGIEVEFDTDAEDGERDDAEFVQWVQPIDEVLATHDPEFAAAALYRIGFFTGPETPTHDDLKQAIRWFQRSTRYYTDESKHLVADGVCGPKTKQGIEYRLKQLRLK